MPVTINGTTGITTAGLDASGTNKFATTIGVGGATPSTSGAGITFPATQSASSNANTLDDYEEGTWTPSFSPGSSTVANCTYTKIGRLVQLTGYIASPSSFGSGTVAISGLPFAGNENYQMSMLWYNGSSSVLAAAYLSGGSTTLILRPIGGAPSTFTELSVQMSYITST